MTDSSNAITAPAPKAKPARKAPAKAPAQSKTAMVAALLVRAGGTTRADILKATGWPAVSVQQMAKAAGLKLKISKKPGEPSRYSATAPKAKK